MTPPPAQPPAPAPQPRRRLRLPHAQEAGLLLVILLLGAFLTVFAKPLPLPNGSTVNGFLRLENLVGNVATPMSWMAVMAVGATFVIISGGIDISVGSIYGLAALGTAGVLENLAPDASAWKVIPLALAVSLGIGLACGLINGALVVGLRIHPFIVTLGMLSIFRGIALVSVPTKALPLAGQALPAALTRDGIGREVWLHPAHGAAILIQPVPMVVMLLCVAAGWVYLAHCVGGRQIYAVGGNEEAARFSGLPVGRIKLRVYAVSGLTAGLAGMMATGFFGAATSATGEGYELNVIAAAAVGGASLAGGRGTALGALLGALVIGMIENGIYVLREFHVGPLTFSLSQEYSKIIIGVAIILAVGIDRLSVSWRARRLAKAGAGGGGQEHSVRHPLGSQY